MSAGPQRLVRRSCRWLAAVLAVLLLAALLPAGCGGGRPDTTGKVLRVGNGGEPRDLDPHTVTGTPEASIIFALIEGLVAYHPTDDEIPYPGVAERWETSEDGRVWRFHLRADARWSNGDPVTAHDFVYAWRRVLNPSLGNEYADWLYMIKGAEAYNTGRSDDVTTIGVAAEGDHVFVVTLGEPVADFLKMLLNHTFLPVHPPTIEAHGGAGLRNSGWTAPESYVGNGPFRLAVWKPNSIIRIERNPRYWDAAAVRLDAVEFYPIEDENTELRAFESGQLHVTTSVPVNQRAAYREKRPDVIRFDPFAGVYFYRLNMTRPPLDDVRVRRALALAVDRESIIRNLLKGGERVATGMVPSGTGGYLQPDRDVHDPAAARALLAEAGYPGGRGFPVLELLYNTSDNHRKIAEAVQNMWRTELGIDITLVNKEWKVYLNATQDMQYDISRAGWIASLYPFSFLRILLSTSPNNETGFSDPEYDRVLLASTHEMDHALRLAMVREAEERMLASQPVIPLYWYTNVFLVDPRVRGWAPKLIDQRPWKLVDLAESGL